MIVNIAKEKPMLLFLRLVDEMDRIEKQKAEIPEHHIHKREALDPDTCYIKIFHPLGRYTYYVFELSNVATIFSENDWVLFGYCLSPQGEQDDEWGSQSLAELMRSGHLLEIDEYFPGVTKAELAAGKRP